jgi:uncharacterized protein (TIGR03437 family)
VGLDASAVVRCLCTVGILSSTLFAAPQLRLLETTVGPVSTAVGASGPTQTVEATNNGDGSLNLSVRSSAAWAVPSVGAARSCGIRQGICLPISIALQTSALAKGIFTSTVTVNDPNALDAPQTITVTVQVGGGVPDKVDQYAAPNGSTVTSKFYTNAQTQSITSTQSGGDWLSVSLDGSGSFRFIYPYLIKLAAPAGMAAGTYNGTITTFNSTFAPDNKQIPVTMRVTTQPIAEPAPASVAISIAQGSAKQKKYAAIANRGLGTLTLGSVSVNSVSGGNWLTAELVAGTNLVALTADAGSLAVGTYQASVSVASNAANGAVTIPVQLDVLADGAPQASANGAVNNATFEGGEALAQGDLVAIFGARFSAGDPLSATSLPLATQLGGTQVFVNDRAVPLFYSSFDQVNFQLPFDTPEGQALIRVDRNGQRGNTITADVRARVPRILRLGIGDYGIIVNQDGTFPIPATPGIASRPARVGDALVIYAIGLGATSPGVTSGAASPAVEPLGRVPVTTVSFGSSGIAAGIAVDALFSGLTPGFVGLYQINVIVPQDSPRGDNVTLRISMAGGGSNVVRLAVQ